MVWIKTGVNFTSRIRGMLSITGYPSSRVRIPNRQELAIVSYMCWLLIGDDFIEEGSFV